jgi:hypothetical protein
MFNWLRRKPTQLAEQRRRMSDTLTDYPLYEPIHRQGPNCPRHFGDTEAREYAARGRENFMYFMEQRHARLNALRTFLEKFNVTVNLDDEGLANVSQWLPGNCGALVPNPREDETMQLFYQHLAPWEGRWRGLNVVFDLAIFLGECVTARNKRLHWVIWPGTSEDGAAVGSGYHIGGFRLPRDGFDPMNYMLRLSGSDENDLRNGSVGRWVKADRLIGTVRDFSTR